MKKTTTKGKTVTKRKSVVKTVRGRGRSEEREMYRYDTKIGVVAKNFGFSLGDISPDIKLGDFLKDEYPAAARILKMMK